MGDLLNFDDDDDNLFKPPENKMDKSFDDIFGDIADDSASGDTLDDILTPDITDDIFNTPSTKKVGQKRSLKKSPSLKKSVNKKAADNLFGDVDEEPDLFSTGSEVKHKEQEEKSLLDDDLFGPLSTKSEKETKISDELDDFFGTSSTEPVSQKKSNDLDDLFGPVSQPYARDLSTEESVFESKSHDTLSSPSDDKKKSLEKMHEKDSLDMLLESQPLGTVPSCDDLLSIVDPETNSTASTNIQIKHVDKQKVGDLKYFFLCMNFVAFLNELVIFLFLKSTFQRTV